MWQDFKLATKVGLKKRCGTHIKVLAAVLPALKGSKILLCSTATASPIWFPHHHHQ